jgi:hypothetical protein
MGRTQRRRSRQGLRQRPGPATMRYTPARYFLRLVKAESAVRFCSIIEPGGSATTATSIVSVPKTMGLRRLTASRPSAGPFTEPFLRGLKKGRLSAASLIVMGSCPDRTWELSLGDCGSQLKTYFSENGQDAFLVPSSSLMWFIIFRVWRLREMSRR